MKLVNHIALIAAVSFFASCAKNELVEPLHNAPAIDASVENPATGTTPLFDTDATLGTPATHTTPLLDADTPADVVVTHAQDPSAMLTGSNSAPVNAKTSYAHNLEVQ